MGKFWTTLRQMFKPAAPAPDPAQVAMERRIAMNRYQGELAQAVRRQDRFLKEYISQAVEAKRTGDSATLRSIKGMIVQTMAMRKRAQRMLNASKLAATKVDQMGSFREFIGMLEEASRAMAEQGFSTEQLVRMQQDLAEGMQKAQNQSEAIDQALDALDATMGGLAERSEVSAGISDSALDEMIAKLSGEKDTAAESRLEELLAKI